MDGIASWLVALENVASNFSHFIIEHWIPAQAVLVELHDATAPLVRGQMQWPIMGIHPPSLSDLVVPF